MTLYWQSNGLKDAPTIVFLHGMGVSSWMWTEQVEALKNDYHCLTIDLPGNGKSHTTSWNSVAESADQVAEVIRAHATNGKAHLVALSLEGYVALQLLVRHPNLVERVIVSGLSTTPLKHGWLLMRVATLLYPLMA